MTTALAAAADGLASSQGDLAKVGLAVRQRLEEPLRVGVVGRVSSGKSTLVNALLAQRIAPTAAVETTRVPAWFTHGPWTTAQVAATGRPSRAVELDDGRLPSELPTGFDQADTHFEVTLSTPLLQELTLVDTPGTASATAGVSERTAALLSAASASAMLQVEVLLLVLPGALHADEEGLLRSFAGAVLDTGTIPALAALTHIDRLDHTDPDAAFKEAQARAQELAEQHSDLFAAVLPVAGLLAETAATGALSEVDARNLAELAATWDEEDQRQHLVAQQVFLMSGGSLDEQGRRRLLQRLDLAGIAICLNHLRRQPSTGAAGLTSLLLDVSGREALLATLRESLAGRADLLKAAAAVPALARAAADPQLDERVAGPLSDALDAPVLAPLRLARALAGLRSSRTPLPPDLGEDVARARTHALPRTSPTEAAEKVGRWRLWARAADGPGRVAAEEMCRAWHRASGGDGRS